MTSLMIAILIGQAVLALLIVTAIVRNEVQTERLINSPDEVPPVEQPSVAERTVRAALVATQEVTATRAGTDEHLAHPGPPGEDKRAGRPDVERCSAGGAVAAAHDRGIDTAADSLQRPTISRVTFGHLYLADEAGDGSGARRRAAGDRG